MESVAEKGLRCVWQRHEVVNYAMQQNFVPIVTKIELHNTLTENLCQVTVRIKSEPEFATEWSKTLDVIPAGQKVQVGVANINLSGAFLAELTERLNGSLVLEVVHDDEILFRESSVLSVLAYDQWGGLSSMPEMIAAFIMPNHPVIPPIISEASILLEKWTGSPSFDAYQNRNPNRIRHQAAAIYSVLQSKRLTYCVAPASFEEIGQRVRLPGTVVGNSMGNCLDVSLLYAACLEAVGLHPLVIFTKGHAFPGVWLIEETFSESVQDDFSLLTKRLAAGVHELTIVEATMMCSGSSESFQQAESAAILNLEPSDHFFGFVDVKRARASAIRPLPLRVSTPDGWEILQGNKEVAAAIEVPEDVKIHQRPLEVSKIAVTKQKQWERKLLDLTLRNTLLNFRFTKSALPLLQSRLGELEDALAEGQEFELLSKPSDWEGTERSAELFRSISNNHPLVGLVHQEFLNKRLRTDANDRELADKSIHLYRSARLSLEENGANTLYLALGLLRWYESAVSEMPRYAPIVLVPVELVRKSSRSGFVLRARDEEPQINITLLEMLRQDFGKHIGGLDPLPRDDKGIDLEGIFTTLRHVIMNMPRWDIVESAILGLFSFGRFVMWNDIRSRADDLAKNKVVASLMSGQLEWEPGETFPKAEQLDELFSPDKLLLPISADSSQITAVSAAGNEKSFVLHGPPGTGKSQTITNIIASSLAEGKTVLFVAEKMAALSVVQSRLEQIGLGPFCLELHSNKSTKKAVLDQLRKTIETSRAASPEEWTRQAEQLASSRKELNGYVASLHKRYSFGASLYEAISKHGIYQSAPSVALFDTAVIGGMTVEEYTLWVNLVRELSVAGEAAGHPFGNVWSDVKAANYTPAMRSQVEELLRNYNRTISKLQTAYGKVKAMLETSPVHPTWDKLLQMEAVLRLLSELPTFIPVGFLKTADMELGSRQIEKTIQHGRSRNEIRSIIKTRFSDEMLSYDAASTLSEWRKADMRWFLPKFLVQNRIHKAVQGLALPGAVIQKHETVSLLSSAITFSAEAEELQKMEAAAAPLLGAAWNYGEADWEEVRAAHEWTLKIRLSLLPLYGDALLERKAREGIADLFSAGKEAFQQRHGEDIAQFLKAVRELRHLEEQLASLLQIDFRNMDARRDAKPWFEFRTSQAEQWSESLHLLREWCSWKQVSERASAAGLASIVAVYESGQLQHTEVIPSFELAWWKTAINYILETDKQLASFSGRLFEEKIKVFQEVASQFEQLTRQEIAARLAANIPPLSNQSTASSSESGILLRAIRSGGRGITLRKLFEQIPNLLNRICPCILMSPMSVAQYLDPKYALFDLVVFDEASQLPTSEAVGAMARGRNVIVVGDPKQLPPTSFFSSSASGEEEDAIVPEDLESILDDCLALGMPQEHLLWHYRSRHESLIAFSNRRFYENKLLTFPSPFERNSNVKWHPVEGYYDRGKTKQNRAEAERVTDEIARRLRDPELSALSMGVVTFNSIQQTLIEDLLDDLFRHNPDLEQAASQLYEPIFIKNLENVQGDERDVILFSIGYGPDANGRVVLNFGPLNREGGWRRLNVAVSRARHEMHVFSTLRSEHLDISRTRAQGVEVLKAFLEYAEKGGSALAIQAEHADIQEKGIETQIAEGLKKKGYKVDLHIGASGYRMDLAIVNPENPDTYLLAVLCDGTAYRTGKTARDRELLRAQVLTQLGWRIHRVWSMDWLDNPERELDRILEAAKEIKAVSVMKERQVLEDKPHLAAEQRPLERTLENASQALPVNWRTSYNAVTVQPVSLPSEEFYHPQNEHVVKEQIMQVVRGEGPISRNLLARRVIQAWGMARSGSRIDKHLDELITSLNLRKTSWDGFDFYWPEEVGSDDYKYFRVSEGETERRSAEELPPEETANAVREVLFMQGSMLVEDLIKETVKVLGYSRAGAALDKVIRNGAEAAVRRGAAEVKEGRIFYKAGE